MTYALGLNSSIVGKLRAWSESMTDTAGIEYTSSTHKLLRFQIIFMGIWRNECMEVFVHKFKAKLVQNIEELKAHVLKLNRKHSKGIFCNLFVG